MNQGDLLRVAEVATVVPMLHAPAGKLTVALVGPAADLLLPAILSWRDVERVLVPKEPALRDKRVEVAPTLPPASVDVLLLSPEQQADSWLPAVRSGGVVQSLTLQQSRLPGMVAGHRAQLGNMIPWREHTSPPIYGALSRVGGPPKATRKLPQNTKRLTEKYLPCLFLFGRDELPLVFPAAAAGLAAKSGTITASPQG